MIIYQIKQKYSEDTGKPYQIKVYKEHRDDFTGEVLELHDLYCTYNLDYGSADAAFGCGNGEFEFGQEYKIDIHEFLDGDYHFKYNTDGIHNECLMMEHYIKKAKKEKTHCPSFAEMCRESRVLSAIKLMKKKIIQAQDLSIEI